MGRLLKLETKYKPCAEILNSLEILQDWFTDTDRDILVKCKFNKGDYILRKDMLASRLRDRWKVINCEGLGRSSSIKETS